MSFYKPNFIDNVGLTVPDYIIQNVASTGGGIGGVILLSNATVTEFSSIGTVVGNFSVSGGSTRTYTFTLTTNPSTFFAVGGSTLSVNTSPLSVGDVPITVRASDTGASVLNGGFTITVTSTGGSAYAPTYPYVGF